ncbi:hypothetical protein CDD81_2266 [Ophiocordyceps australis]|uniref:Uncharacterized protein n=1 Tax=Ophiocordyceps australis TaxID=1399860 RepID=A0A2C5YCP9_9HYPO|nr:hypothetical protein CDD81_2266 [Ophiocordyceps australis]
MQYTKFALSLRNFFAAYHEPPALSKQQLDRLLQGLKTSFRAKLDHEYGHVPDTSQNAPSIGKASPIRSPAASRHIKSMLANPIFSRGAQPAASASSASPPSLSASKRDPMEVFDHAVSKDLMTIKAAIGCLIAKSQHFSPTSGSAQSSPNTAARVIRWLHSSCEATDLKFLDNPHFIRLLTPFLLAEGLDNVAWEWISRMVNGGDTSCGRRLRATRASNMLSALIKTKSQGHQGHLNAAISTLLEAEQRYRNSPLLPDILRFSWRIISWRSTVEAHNRTSPSEQLFDAHIAVSELFQRPLVVEKAHLHLCHPTHPSDAPALHFFNDRQALRKLTQRLVSNNVALSKIGLMDAVLWIIHLGNDTVNYLYQSGRTREAEDVTNLLHLELAGVFSNASSPNPT